MMDMPPSYKAVLSLVLSSRLTLLEFHIAITKDQSSELSYQRLNKNTSFLLL